MKKILLLLANGFEIFEASAFIDVFGWNLVEGDNSTELFTCGPRKEIKSSFNQRIIVDHLIGDIDIGSFDALVIPGGFEEYGFYQDAYKDEFLNVIRGFKANDKFIQTENEKLSFYMVGRSKDKIEAEPIGQIKFIILDDGTVVSDSNYLPSDVNKLAHEAMDNIDFNFSSKRVMTKKEIPLKYREKIAQSKTAQIQNLKNK